MSIIELIPAVMAVGADIDKKRQDADKKNPGNKAKWDKIWEDACDKKKCENSIREQNM